MISEIRREPSQSERNRIITKYFKKMLEPGTVDLAKIDLSKRS